MTKFRTLSLAVALSLASSGLFANSAPYTAYDRSCDCKVVPIATISIDEINTSHPRQFILEPINAYHQLEDKSGKVLIDKLYEITTYPDGRIVAKRGGYFGVIAADGKTILDFSYDDIEVLNSNLYQLTKHFSGKRATAIVNGSGKWLYPTNAKFNQNIQVTPLYFDATNTISYFIVFENNKYGLINDHHKTLIPSIYDELKLVDTDPNGRLFLTVKLGDKSALIDQSQKIIVPFAKNLGINKFDFDNQIFSIKKLLPDATFSESFTDAVEIISETLINKNGIKLIESEGAISYAGGNLNIFKQADKFGIVDYNAKIVLPAKFDYIDHRPIGILAYNGDKIGLVTEGDKVLEVAKYYDDLEFVNIQDMSLADLQASISTDVYNEDLTEKPKLFNPLYDDPKTADDDPTYYVTEVVIDAKSESDENLIKNAKPLIYKPREVFFIATLDNKYGLVDHNNSVRIPIIYDEAQEFGNFLKVRKGNKYGLLTAANEIVAEVTYEAIDFIYKRDFLSDLEILLTKDGQQRIIDSVGNNRAELLDYRVVNDTFENNRDISVIERDGKYGLINIKNNQIIVEPIFEDLSEDKSADTFLALLDGKRVSIDKYGTILIDNLSQYETTSGSEYNDNLLVKTRDGKIGVVTNTGEVLIPAIYDTIEDKKVFDNFSARYKEENGSGQVFYQVEKEGLFGVLNDKGETVVPIVYGTVQILPYPAYILATKNSNPQDGGLGLLDTSGKPVTDMKYDGFRMTPYPTGEASDRIYMINFATNIIDEYDFDLNLVGTQSADVFKNSYSLMSP